MVLKLYILSDYKRIKFYSILRKKKRPEFSSLIKGLYEKLCFDLQSSRTLTPLQNTVDHKLRRCLNKLEEGRDLGFSEHQNLSGAALTAIEGDVLIAGVRVKPADALFIAQETCVGSIT